MQPLLSAPFRFFLIPLLGRIYCQLCVLIPIRWWLPSGSGTASICTGFPKDLQQWLKKTKQDIHVNKHGLELSRLAAQIHPKKSHLDHVSCWNIPLSLVYLYKSHCQDKTVLTHHCFSPAVWIICVKLKISWVESSCNSFLLHKHTKADCLWETLCFWEPQSTFKQE